MNSFSTSPVNIFLSCFTYLSSTPMNTHHTHTHTHTHTHQKKQTNTKQNNKGYIVTAHDDTNSTVYNILIQPGLINNKIFSISEYTLTR